MARMLRHKHILGSQMVVDENDEHQCLINSSKRGDVWIDPKALGWQEVDEYTPPALFKVTMLLWRHHVVSFLLTEKELDALEYRDAVIHQVPSLGWCFLSRLQLNIVYSGIHLEDYAKLVAEFGVKGWLEAHRIVRLEQSRAFAIVYVRNWYGKRIRIEEV